MRAVSEARGDAPELRELFAALAAGRIGALETIYDAAADGLYGLALWRTGSEADAADVVQDVFVRLAGLGRRLAAIDDPAAYLKRMAHRASIDVHRRRKRRREEPVEACRFLECPATAPDRNAEAHHTSKLLAILPPRQREAIYLRDHAGCSFAEIGRITGVPTFTAASRHRLGIRRLRDLMGVKR